MSSLVRVINVLFAAALLVGFISMPVAEAQRPSSGTAQSPYAPNGNKREKLPASRFKYLPKGSGILVIRPPLPSARGAVRSAPNAAALPPLPTPRSIADTATPQSPRLLNRSLISTGSIPRVVTSPARTALEEVLATEAWLQQQADLKANGARLKQRRTRKRVSRRVRKSRRWRARARDRRRLRRQSRSGQRRHRRRRKNGHFWGELPRWAKAAMRPVN